MHIRPLFPFIALLLVSCQRGPTSPSEAKAGVLFEGKPNELGEAAYMMDFASEAIDPVFISFGDGDMVEAPTNAHCIYSSLARKESANLAVLKQAKPVTPHYIDRGALRERLEGTRLWGLYSILIGLELNAEMAEETIEDPILFEAFNPNTDQRFDRSDMRNFLDHARASEVEGAERCPKSHPDLKKLEAES